MWFLPLYSLGMESGPPIETPNVLASPMGIFPLIWSGELKSFRIRYQNPPPWYSFVPPRLTTVRSVGCEYSALLAAVFTRNSEMPSTEGNSSLVGPP